MDNTIGDGTETLTEDGRRQWMTPAAVNRGAQGFQRGIGLRVFQKQHSHQFSRVWNRYHRLEEAS